MSNLKQRSITRGRSTLGFLTNSFVDTNCSDLWAGINDAARQHDVNLICLVGDELHNPLGFRGQANVLYDLIHAESVAGLIIWGGALGNFVGQDAIREFCEHFRPLPVVNVAMPIPGIPSVYLDSYQGMYQAIEHLIQVHGHRRLAFIRGPEGNREAAERYRAYREILPTFEIAFDPTFVRCAEYWFEPYGTHAMHALLDLHGHTIDAVAAANDRLALGALEALRMRGLRIPDDVALVGFDNLSISWCATPPLTTVPLQNYQQGYRAVELVMAQLAGQEIPEQAILPGQLLLRQSCGCLAPELAQAARPPEPTALTIHSLERAGADDRLAAEIARAAGVSAEHTDAIAQLSAAFLVELTGTAAPAFLPRLEEILRQAVGQGKPITIWQNIISELRRSLSACDPQAEAGARAEILWHQARIMIGMFAERAQAYQRGQADDQAAILQEISQTLLTTLHVPELMDILAQELPRLGIPGCYLALYEDPHVPAGWAHLHLAFNRQDRVDLPAQGQRFPSRQLVPEGVLDQERPQSLMVEALYFREHHSGFAAFEVGPPDGKIYDVLRSEISSALYSARLVQRIEERTAALAREKYIIDTFMATVPDSIYFKDGESRFTRANQAIASLFHVPDPAALIGKSDFDFFPEEHARPKYEQEQAILRTGQALINQEEPDAQGHWALTTKMPLRDEHGDIIGTFGISRDITPLKQAQEALATAYQEIRVLNEKLQADNLRMSAELDVSRRIQQMILPPPEELRQIQGLEIVGHMQPANEVGGDYYDVLRKNGVIHIGIGDVTGHGLESGLVMLMTQTAIRTLIEHGETDPAAFLDTLNRTMYKNIRRMKADKMLTLSVITCRAGQLNIVGQHEEVLIVRRGGRVERIDTMDLGFFLGLQEEIRGFVAEAIVSLEPGDSAVLYTDGITEAENAAHKLYGLERLCDVLSRHWNRSAEAIKQAVMDDVTRHVGTHKVYDDMTLVVLKQQ